MDKYICMKCLKPSTKSEMKEPTQRDEKRGGSSKRCPNCGNRTFVSGGNPAS